MLVRAKAKGEHPRPGDWRKVNEVFECEHDTPSLWMEVIEQPEPKPKPKPRRKPAAKAATAED